MVDRDSFFGFHPIVNLLYFVSIIGFSMVFMHPVFLGISFISSAIYGIYLYGKKSLMAMLFLLPMLLITAGLNPLFNHAGATIIGFLPNGNPITLESTLFGIGSSVMLVTVIIWFACLNAVLTSDKIVYLFGRIIPALALILSMSLRFVPRFIEQIKIIANAQYGIGRDIRSGSIFSKAKNGIKILSIVITWALENSIETADSMSGRGYGLKGRTAFSIFKFDKRDGYAFLYILFCIIVVITGAVSGVYRFRYFPTIQGEWTGGATIFIFITYFTLAMMPIAINLKEDFVWRRLESKI